MDITILTILAFIIALIVSTLVIYVVTKLFGETEDIKTALLAAVIGTVIYAVVYFLMGHGLIAAIIGGIAWLIALRALYKIGWLKSLAIAVIIWILTSIVGWFLPTLMGPV
ncbi:conserved hypothetical protein [Methanocella paludicola SANAE]|uniref:Uncharacterized protein n=1 Tax=Methanocella paludicola (strain DSM 17711 / JCM 13418 / NBRC 101707 / SANAE) TaxID=304371 RepID=D1Z0P4_METPS|nr:hypothetical protein [Methanocella paludicola]BAI62266.1 conserved hypothetical protein [Methanocella paludicola SANAE]